MGRHDWLTVSYLGVVQIGVAYTLFTAAMARGVRSLDAGIVGYIEPVLNPIWVFVILGERPSQWALEHMRVVEPIINKEAGTGVTIVVGLALPGLGLDRQGPIVTECQSRQSTANR